MKVLAFVLALIASATVLAQGTTIDIGQGYPVQVNYNLTLAQAVIAGKYGTQNILSDDDEKRRGVKQIMVYLVNLGTKPQWYDGSLERILAEQGLRPVTTRELLAFGAAYPSKQIKNDIIGMGGKSSDVCGVFAPLLSFGVNWQVSSDSKKIRRFDHHAILVLGGPGCSHNGEDMYFGDREKKGLITLFAATKAR